MMTDLKAVANLTALVKYSCLSGLRLMPIILATGCGVTLGPAYDSAQDDPKNALPESITFLTGSDKAIESNSTLHSDGEKVSGSESVAVLASSGDYKNTVEYKQWIDAKESNSKEYQEFLEFRQWLAFKELKSAE